MALLKVKGSQLEDVLWRALGTLSHARLLDLKEFMSLRSQLRLGVGLGMFSGIRVEDVNDLMILGQAGALKKRAQSNLDRDQISSARAKTVRAKIRAIMDK